MFIGIMNAILVVAAMVWYKALVTTDGVIVACVDCLNEGWIEFGFFLSLWGLGTFCLMWSMIDYAQANAK